MNIYFISRSSIGTDAPGWYIGADGKIHRVPGWNPEALAELGRALNVLRDAGQFKTPGLAEATIKGVLEFAHKELNAHVKGGGSVVVLG